MLFDHCYFYFSIFKAYLSKKTCQININEELSSPLSINSDIPQGVPSPEETNGPKKEKI